MQPIMKLPAKQKGIALIMLVIIIALAFISYMMSGLSLTEIRLKQEEKTLAALKKAKQALLAYAMNYPDVPGVAVSQGPGNLPCPAEEDGIRINVGPIGAGPACSVGAGFPGAVGRFPWATLETGPLYDGSGELLWYVVSDSYAAVGGNQINTSTIGNITMKNRDGTLSIDGASNDAIIAVIIAPGETLVRDDGVVQSRTAAAERLDAINYLDIAFSGGALEEDNADFTNSSATDGFIPGPIVDAANNVIVNDQFVTITYEEIMELVHARAAVDISNAITDYEAGCGGYPDAASFPNPPPPPPAFDSTQGDGAYISNVGITEGHIPVDSTDWDPGGCADGKLPAWVEAEQWHLHTYYEFCDPADCLQVNQVPPLPVVNNVDALIVFAGRDTTAGPNRPSALTSDYFEGENDDINGAGPLVYDAAQPEDYVHIIAP
jgi:hypothetical protein